MPTCCGQDALQNHALGNTFYVCTKCKKEVFPTDAALQTKYDLEYSDWATFSPADYEQLELFTHWMSGDTLTLTDKEDTDNG